MESVKGTKNAKAVTAICNYQPVRLRQGTFKKLQKIVDAVNKKDFGRKVRADSIIDAALSLVGAQQIEALRNGSMSNSDKLERMYRDYCAKDRSVSKDVFLGMLLGGELVSRRDGIDSPRHGGTSQVG